MIDTDIVGRDLISNYYYYNYKIFSPNWNIPVALNVAIRVP